LRHAPVAAAFRAAVLLGVLVGGAGRIEAQIRPDSLPADTAVVPVPGAPAPAAEQDTV
jgi:hypothetical protein